MPDRFDKALGSRRGDTEPARRTLTLDGSDAVIAGLENPEKTPGWGDGCDKHAEQMLAQLAKDAPR